MNKKIVLSYVDDCVYWYTSEALGKWFVGDLVKRFHVTFLGYEHWFMLIIISHMKDHYISVDQARYGTSIVAKYLDTATVKTGTKFYNTTLPFDMIFTKSFASTNDDKVEKLTRELNIHYRACTGSLIYLLFKRVNFSSTSHKVEFFSSNTGKVPVEGLVYLLRYIRDNKTLGLKYYVDMKDVPLSDLLIKAIIKTEKKIMAFSDFS